MRVILLCFFVVCTTGSLNAQELSAQDLFETLRKQDSIFFENAFNLCDLKYLENAIHPEIIFYHDQAGIQNRSEFLLAVRNNICADRTRKPVRKVDRGSLQVFPLYKGGQLYGAIQTGVHDFYIREQGKQDLHTSTARFTHVWMLDSGKWLLKEVLSYDHKSPQ